jgi:hypothetical protein
VKLAGAMKAVRIAYSAPAMPARKLPNENAAIFQAHPGDVHQGHPDEGLRAIARLWSAEAFGQSFSK